MNQTNNRIIEEFKKEYHTKECLGSEYINCICPKISETESIKEQFIQQYKSEFPPNTEIFRGIIADWWLSKIDELLKSQREETQVEYVGKDELYCGFWKCLTCNNSNIPEGSNYCSNCGRKTIKDK